MSREQYPSRKAITLIWAKPAGISLEDWSLPRLDQAYFPFTLTSTAPFLWSKPLTSGIEQLQQISKESSFTYAYSSLRLSLHFSQRFMENAKFIISHFSWNSHLKPWFMGKDMLFTLAQREEGCVIVASLPFRSLSATPWPFIPPVLSSLHPWPLYPLRSAIRLSPPTLQHSLLFSLQISIDQSWIQFSYNTQR